MTVTVRLSEPLRSKAGARQVRLVLPVEHASLAQVLDELARQCPAIAADLRQPADALDANYTIFHNVRVVHFAEQGNIQLRDGDELSIFLPMVGGQWSLDATMSPKATRRGEVAPNGRVKPDHGCDQLPEKGRNHRMQGAPP
ncbi:MAG: MoaD/ThiS family protein [Chloroflexi bacterium]|nr:MoaD/ThiS family protein [Chloroflexota bacterium]